MNPSDLVEGYISAIEGYDNEKRQEITVDGNKAIQLDYDHLTDGTEQRSRVIMTAMSYHVVVLLITLPRADFDKDIAAFDPVIASLKANPEYKFVDKSGYSSVDLMDFMSLVDIFLEKDGLNTLGKCKYTKEAMKYLDMYTLNLTDLTQTLMIGTIKGTTDLTSIAYIYPSGNLSEEDQKYNTNILSSLYGQFCDDTHSGPRIEEALGNSSGKTEYDTNYWKWEREEKNSWIRVGVYKK